MTRKQSKSIKLAGTVTVGPKGQVVIPCEVRELMNIEPGDKLLTLYIPEKQSVGFVAESRAQTIINKLGDNFEKLDHLPIKS